MIDTGNNQGRSRRNRRDVGDVGYWLALIFAALLLSSLLLAIARADEPPSTASTVVYGTTMALIATDYLQTRSAQREGFAEGNPILGRRPSQTAIAAWFAAYMVGVTLLHYSGANGGFMLGIGIAEGYAVGHNAHLGVRIRW